MRNFNPNLFPTNNASFIAFNRFPMDIGLAVGLFFAFLALGSDLGMDHQILEHCSPFDLAQLFRTSRFFRSFVTVHPHLWNAARHNLALPAPPDVQASGNYSQSAYALWLFDGGPCTVCFSTFHSTLAHGSEHSGAQNGPTLSLSTSTSVSGRVRCVVFLPFIRFLTSVSRRGAKASSTRASISISAAHLTTLPQQHMPVARRDQKIRRLLLGQVAASRAIQASQRARHPHILQLGD